MNQTAIALIVGLLAGTAGAVVVGFVSGGAASTSTPTDAGMDLSAITERLDRIEVALDRDGPLSAGALRGDGTAEGSAAAAAAEARLDRLVAKLEERIAPIMKETVSASVKEAIEASSGSIEMMDFNEPPKKEATLAEVAAELELTAEQEEAVRRIATETTEGFLKLLVDENSTIDDVRAEFEAAKTDPTKKIELATKYMGKAMTNLGGLMGLMMGHEQKMTSALGADKKRKLESGYKISDLDPYGIEDMFDFD